MAESLVTFLVKCFYLMLPAYFANMAPVITRRINLFNFPIDFGKQIGNKPILGKNKTFRGLFFGIIFALFVAFMQSLLYNIDFFKFISFIDYNNWLLFGLLMGSGALSGDLAKSFFKRRLGLKPGATFVPFDQTDFVVGTLLFITPLFKLTWRVFLVTLALSFVLHIIVNHAAYYLKIRDEKW